MGKGHDLSLIGKGLAGISALRLQQAQALLGEAPWLAILLSQPWAASSGSGNGIATTSCSYMSRGPKESLKGHMPRSKLYNKETYEHLRQTRWDLDEMRKLLGKPARGQGSSEPGTSTSAPSSSSSKTSKTSSGGASSSSTSTSSSGAVTSSSSAAQRSLLAPVKPHIITRLISEAVTIADIRAVVLHYGASFDAICLAAAITKVPKAAAMHGTVTIHGDTRLRPSAPVERLLDRLVPRLPPLLHAMSARELSNVLWALCRAGYDPGEQLLWQLWRELLQGGSGSKLGKANGQELALLATAAQDLGQAPALSSEVWAALEGAVVAAAEAQAGGSTDADGKRPDAAFVAFNGHAASVIASQFVRQRRSSRRLLSALGAWAAVPGNLRGTKPKQVAGLLGAFAAAPIADVAVPGHGMLSVLCQRAADKVWDASLEELGHMAWAAGKLKGPSTLLEAIAGRLESTSGAKGQEAAEGGSVSVPGMKSFADLGLDSGIISVSSSARGSSSASNSSLSPPRTIHGVPMALAKIAWATAQLGGPARPILLRAAADRLATHPSEFAPIGITMVLSAAAKLSSMQGFSLPGGWWAKVGLALAPLVGGLTASQVGIVAYAFAHSGQPASTIPRALLNAIADVAERRAAEFDSRDIASVVCAFQRLRFYDGNEAAQALGVELAKQLQQGKAAQEHVTRTAQALECLGVNVPGLLDPEVMDSYQLSPGQPPEEVQVTGSGALQQHIV